MNSEIINGIKIYAPNSKNEFLNYIYQNKQILVAVNAEKIMKSNHQAKDIINRNFGYPDGIGAVWALKRKGYNDVIKIAGCDLWLEIIAKYHNSKSFYIVGGSQIVIKKTVLKLKNEFTGINILNSRNGYLKSKNETKALIQNIKELSPDFVFVAMGSPKQEFLMQAMQQEHKATYQGLGGSFDVYTGNINRAPRFWINANLEWAYRLFKEPSRIKRQITYIPFLIKLIFNKL
jgi:UDP-N-acetyl-D-mannosaminouronate:lipid I N-acetyl-D-mannosaminouronosyltransferase